jgi:hypothetical protein
MHDRSRHRLAGRRRGGLGGAGRGLAAAAALAVGAGVGGCGANEPHYFPSMGALEVDGTGTEAKQTLQLVFRTPTDAEEQARQSLTAQLNYEVPWLREDRLHVEVRFTITNLDDREASFSLNVDGASEFARYDEDAVAAAFKAANQDNPIVHGLYQAPPPVNGQLLGPGEVYQGTVREDDFREMALDLDAMGRWMAPNFPAVLLYRSETDPTDSHGEYTTTPPNLIRPALWEITPRFNSTKHMRCDFLVRVRDDDRRLWEDGQNQFTAAPVTYVPMVPPRM